MLPKANFSFISALAFLSVVFNGGLAISEATAADGPRVNTTSGMVTGATFPEAYSFYSIPYAETPQRFMNSEAIAYRGEINATAPDFLMCHQPKGVTCNTSGTCKAVFSEDCLVLNIHVPSTADFSRKETLLPVIVNIHGGSFSWGSGTDLLYDGRWFVNTTNTILVSINYRLGPMGFLVYEEGDTKLNGNQGFKDQQLALRWIQDNIEYFSGDKSSVTLMGNSAGAQAVMFHMLSATSKPMFIRAILQSVPAGFRYPTPERAQKTTLEMLGHLQCNTSSGLECLRKADPDTLVNLSSPLSTAAWQRGEMSDYIEPFRLVVDGVEFTDQPLPLFQEGRWNTDKEMIMGTMADEWGHVDVIYQDTNINASAFAELNDKILGTTIGPLAAAAYEKFYIEDAETVPSYRRVLTDEMSHVLFDCPTRTLARLAQATADGGQPSPVYLYADEHALSGPTCPDIMEPQFCGLALHANELPLVFRTSYLIGYEPSDADNYVQDRFSHFWGNFARTGFPDMPAEKPTSWPPYLASSNGQWPSIRIKAPATEIEQDYLGRFCDFWDSTGIFVNMTSHTTVPVNMPTLSSTTIHTTSGARGIPAPSCLILLAIAFSLFFT